MNPTPKPERDAAMADLYSAGRSLAYIGKLFGVSRQRVQQVLIRRGVERRLHTTRGRPSE